MIIIFSQNQNMKRKNASFSRTQSESLGNEVVINPFDFTYQQVLNARKVFIPIQNSKNGMTRGLSKFDNKATIEKLFQNIYNLIPKLSQDKWRNILKELDQTPYDPVNVSSNLKDKGEDLGTSLDLDLLCSKIQFTDFLKMLQKESGLREILSEHQLFYHSTKRLIYQKETKLITKEAQDAINANREKKASQAKAQADLGGSPMPEMKKVPSVTYGIDQVLMFQFQGNSMLLVTRENKSVQVFESKTGRFVHEFSFYNNVLGQLKNISRQVLQEIENKKKGEEKQELGKFKPNYPQQVKVERMVVKDGGQAAVFNKDLPVQQEQSSMGEVEYSSTVNSLFNQKPQKKDKIFGDCSTTNEDFWSWVNDLSVDVGPSRSKSNLNKSVAQDCAHDKCVQEEKEKILTQITKIDKSNLWKQTTAKPGKLEDLNKQSLLKADFEKLFSKPKPSKRRNLSVAKSQYIPQQVLQSLQDKSSSPNQNLNPDATENILMKAFKAKTGLLVDVQIGNQIKNQTILKIQKNDENARKNYENSFNPKKQSFDLGANKKVKYESARDLSVRSSAQSVIVEKIIQRKSKPFVPKMSQQEIRAKEVRERSMELQKEARQKSQQYQEMVRQSGGQQCYDKYFILGLDPIQEKVNPIQQASTDKEYVRPFGLSDDHFTSANEQNELEDQFKHLIKNIKDEVKRLQKTRKCFRDTKKSMGIPVFGDSDEDEGQVLTVAQLRQMKFEEVQKHLDQLLGDSNAIWKQIRVLKQQQNVLGGWFNDFDDQQRIEIQGYKKELDAIKKVSQARKALDVAVSHINKKKKDPHFSQNLSSIEHAPGPCKSMQHDEHHDVPKWLQTKDARTQMNRDRVKRLKRHQKEQMIEIMEKNSLRRVEERKTYPLQMAYYEPNDLSIFALVTREIQVHELKQTGVKYKFTKIQSLMVENIVHMMSIALHKVSKNLLICLGTEGSNNSNNLNQKSGDTNTENSEVVIFELDQANDCEVVKSFKFTWPHKQITNIIYNGGCGLVVTSFRGFVEIFDSVNLNYSVWDNNDSNSMGSISALDYSKELDILAFGSVSGIIHFIDQTTKKYNGQIIAHINEIKLIKFFDQQHQIISVTINGDVGLFCSQKMQKFQILKNSPYMLQKTISAAYFYEPEGKICLATTKVFNYELVPDETVQVYVDQQNAIARDYLREFFAKLLQCDLIGKPIQKKQGRIPCISPQEFLEGAYCDDTLKDQLAQERNKLVVPNTSSSLVASIFDFVHFQAYTIDCYLMTRVWCLNTGNCLRSYVLETRESQIQQIQQNQDTEAAIKSRLGQKAQLIQADKILKFIIVCFEGGQIQINNLFNGALIYNNYNVSPLKLENEVAKIAFFPSQTQFWIAASCYDGRVTFISVPKISQGRSYLTFQKGRHCSHKRDVLSIDVNTSNQIVSASTDNILCFWNAFSGHQSKHFEVPEKIGSNMKQEHIIFIQFVFENYKDLLLIVFNNGKCFLFDTQSEKFLMFNGKELYGLVCTSPIIGVDQQHLVSLNEQGKGQISYLTNESFEVKETFIYSKKDLERGTCFLNIVVSVPHNIFMVSQRAGQIIFYSLITAEKLCYLNGDSWLLNDIKIQKNNTLIEAYQKQFKKNDPEPVKRFRDRKPTTVIQEFEIKKQKPKIEIPVEQIEKKERPKSQILSGKSQSKKSSRRYSMFSSEVISRNLRPVKSYLE